MRSATPWLLLSAACGGGLDVAAQPVPVPVLDRALHRRHIQPLTERLCAQGACHGSPDRELFLYARFGTRLAGADQLPDLTEPELDANVASLTAQLHGLTDLLESPLLTKPLRPEAGGQGHQGGAQFYDPGDPSFVLLACWILGGRAEGDPPCRP